MGIVGYNPHSDKVRERHPAETTSGVVAIIVAAAAIVFKVELDPVEVGAVVGAVGLIAAFVTGLISRIRGE